MSTVKNTSTYSYTPWSNWSSWNYNDKTVEDNSCSTTSTSLFDYEDDTLGDLTIPLNAYHDNWLGFSDSSWSTSVYRDLLKIESKKKLVGILSYESAKHKLKALLTNGMVRTYTKGRKSKYHVYESL